MRFKRILSFLASAAMTISALCGAMSITASAATTGDLTYSTSSGTLEITVTSQEPGATAAMLDYESGKAPWYGSRTSIKKIEIGEGVTSIGNYAFYNLTNVTDVKLPSTLVTIGDYAFSGLNKWANISFTDAAGEPSETPPKITTFGDYAFNNCSVLATVPASFLQSTTSIGDHAFYNCAKMFPTSQVQTDVLGKLGQYAFYGCTSLTSLKPKTSWSTGVDKITAIPDYAFANSGLTTLTFPRGVEEIGMCAFQNCKSMTKTPSLSLIKKVGQQAFSGCGGLTSIDLMGPDSENFGSNVFEKCTSIQNVSIPGKWTSVPTYMFSGCTGLTTVTTSSATSLKEIGVGAFSGCTNLASFDFPSTVTTIGGSAFSGCSSLAKVQLRSGITEIGSNAFSDCSVLDGIQLPSTLNTLGSGAFKNCIALTYIAIPASVTAISDSAFSGCTNLAEIDLSTNDKGCAIESIGANAFKDCKALKSISLPKNLKTITGQAFIGCTSLTKVISHPESEALKSYLSSNYTILFSADGKEVILGAPGYSINVNSKALTPSGADSPVEKIADYAFAGNEKITSVELYEGLVSIGNNAFDGDIKLTNLNAGSAKTLESIGDYAFRNTGINNINMPKENVLKTIGDSAFYGCKSLATVNFQSDSILESIGDSAFYDCSALKSITIPDSVTNLGTFAFYNCSAMTSAKLPKKLTVIAKSLFRRCEKLQTISIPSSVTSIEDYAFDGCSSLININVPSSVTTLGTYVFQDCTSLKKAVIGGQVTSVLGFVFNGCTNEDLEIYLLGTISSTVTYNTFGLNQSKDVKGTIYVYDETSYTTLSAVDAVKRKSATLVFDVNFAELRSAIADARGLPAVDYTSESYSALASALQLADFTLADYSSNQGRVDAACVAIQNAVDSLVPAGNAEYLNKLAEAVEHAKSLVRTDYRAASYSQLRAAYKAGEEVTGDELNSELKSLIDAIEKAEQNLVVNYAYNDPVVTVRSGSTGGEQSYNNDYHYVYPCIEGTVTPDIAGATQVKVKFQMASHASFNGTTKIDFKSYIQGTDENGNYVDWNTDQPVNGTKEDDKTVSIGGSGSNPLGGTHELTFPIVYGTSNPRNIPHGEGLVEGEEYHFYCWTDEWNEYPQYDYIAFYILEIQLLDAEGNKLLSTKDVNVPNEDLLAAVEEAKLANTANATEDSVQVLNDAVAAANAILEQEKPLPSAMAAAAEAIRDAIANLKQADKPSVDKTELNNEIKSADEMDTSAYTDESVAELKKAIDSAKTVAANENATKEDVDAAVKAIKDAVAALAKKPGSSDSSNNPSGSNNPSVTTPTAAPTTAAPAKRSAQQVAKDKAAAQAKVSQAKITKLTVKSKAKKKINVTWKKVKKAVGYQVQVSTKSNFKKKIFNKFTTKNKLTITNKIKSKKTYYVRVRAYATYKDANNVTKKVYSKWNKKLRKVTVK